jgi:SRSO17 transposase
MGMSALRSKGPSYTFCPDNLRAIGARFMSFCQEYSHHFKVATHSVVNESRAYLSGLVMKSPRKNIERMEEYVESCNYESTQHFISESPWDHREVLDHVARDTSDAIGGSASDLVIDESGFSKKGTKSAGVARQYNGRLGKVDNCQVGVFGALTDGQNVGIIDARLYLPKEWTASKKRCKDAKIPKDQQVFKTKWELGLEIVDNAIRNELSFGTVTFDGFYGSVPKFVEGLTQRDLKFVGAVHKDQMVFTKEPAPYLPRRKEKIGRKYTKYRTREKTIRVDELNETLEHQWQLVEIRSGTKGVVKVNARRVRVWLWEEGTKNIRELWLLITRDVETGEKKYWLSNASTDTSLNKLTQKAAARFFIERSFQDAKTSLGMRDYQVRVWPGWHHHMSLVSMAMLFMLKERLANKKDVSLLSCQDIVELLNYYLPRGDLSEDSLLSQLEARHKKRFQSMDSYYKNQEVKTCGLM